MTDHLDRLRLARTDGVGPILYRRLLRRYHTPAAALAALPELARAGGRKTGPLPPDAAQAEREVAALARIGARLLFLDTPEYPPLLALLDDAPPVIAVQGDAGLLVGARTVALVGGRNASVNGMRIAEELAAGLARAGIVVVSGLARGIDAAGHVGALRAGRTIAAIAGGLDVPYPPENAALQARIAAEGVIVAEATLGTTPQARHFPRRNRIIAGLSLGVVVIEAAPRSGSLITARLAEEAGRELFAVPGSPLDPRCRGSNDLLRQHDRDRRGRAAQPAGQPAAPGHRPQPAVRARDRPAPPAGVRGGGRGAGHGDRPRLHRPGVGAQRGYCPAGSLARHG